MVSDGPTHGLASTYRSRRYKCRCEPCRLAHRELCQQEKASRRERLAANPSIAPHGVGATYRNWACRCGPCSAANAEECRAWYQATR